MALSIRQPWCEAILRLGKRVENRDWAGCSYRGPVLLHASKRLVLRDFDDDVETIRGILTGLLGREVAGLLRQPPSDLATWSTARNTPGWRPAPSLPLGGIVGRARIVGEVKSERDLAEHGAAWWTGGFALVLADVEPLPFIPWKGSLGFFDVPDEVVRRAVAESS